MEYIDQTPFDGVEFAENPEPRCPCLLLLDVSGSMAGRPITELNAGIQAFKEELLSDSMATKRVEIAIVSFGPVQVQTEFQTADTFQPPKLNARGDTPMGAAIEHGLELIKQRKQLYRQNGISFYRPWVFLITDGSPTDSWQKAAQLIHEGEETKSFLFFAVGVEGANMDILSQISTRQPLQLKGLRFRDLFSWLSNSLSSISHSGINDEVTLQSPVTPEGWGKV